MLLSFAAKNYRSIYDRQEVTLLASRFLLLSDGLIREKSIPGGILPIVALYGANAAGKSNMIRALAFIGEAVSRSHNRWEPEAKISVIPHFFHTDERTEFDCQFLLGKQIFKLHFTLDEDKIYREVLTVDRRLVYSRTGRRYRLGPLMKGFEGTKKNARDNSLFLSAAAQNNHPLLKKVQLWFSSWDFVTDNRMMEEAFTGHIISDEAARSFLSKAISVINPEVVGIEPGDGKNGELPPEIEPEMSMLYQDHMKYSQIRFIHQSADKKKMARVELLQESRGTQCYLALANSVLSALVRGSLLLLDEADQSLHPALLRSIVLLFQSKDTNPRRAQFIFNTHDTTLLCPDVMRPDEVWFVERERDLGSRAYCLADFEGIRSDTKAQRAYLDGRFGALPFLEDQGKLFRENILGITKPTHR